MKNTPFTQKHIELGAKMVPFAGYNMPVEYTGIKEEHLAVLFVDADAPVSHRDAHGTVGKGHFDADGLPVRCVLEGIGEEVEEDLFHLVRVEPHREAVHRRGEGEGDVLGFRHGAEVEHHLPEQCDEVGFLDDELHLAVLQFAEVENLVHHAQHPPGVGADE